MKRRIFIAILFLAIVLMTVPPFLYKAIYAPLKTIASLDENGRRGGDFWGSFPAPFVDAYNAQLKDKTCVAYGGRLWGYGPVEHLITLPLTLMSSIKTISLVWFLTNHLFVYLAIAFILLLLRNERLFIKIAVILLWLGFWPLSLAIQEDVIEIFELLMIVLSMYLLYKGADRLSGACMAMAVMTKFLPIIFLPYFIIKKKTGAWTTMLIGIILLAIIAQPVLGWQNSDTLRRLFAEVGVETNDYTCWRSQTINSVIQRYWSVTDYSYGRIVYPLLKDAGPSKLCALVVSLVLLLLVFAAIFKRRRRADYGLEFGMLALLMILLPPHAHPYYLIFALVGYSIVLPVLYKTRYAFGMTIFAISYFLSGLIIHLSFFDTILQREVRRHVFFHFLSFPAYGIMLLLALIYLLYIRESDNA